MATKKTIAIIGATEKTGAVIATSLATGKNRLLLMSGDAEKLDALKTKLETANVSSEVDTLTCTKEACWEADIIIIATPHEAATEIADKIREVATGKIVISISSSKNTAAEELQKLLPNTKVINSFGTAFIDDYKLYSLDGRPLDAVLTEW